MQIHADVLCRRGVQEQVREGIIYYTRQRKSKKPQFVRVAVKRAAKSNPHPTSRQLSWFGEDLGKPRGGVILINVTVFFLRKDIGTLGEPLVCEGPCRSGTDIQKSKVE